MSTRPVMCSTCGHEIRSSDPRCEWCDTLLSDDENGELDVESSAADHDYKIRKDDF